MVKEAKTTMTLSIGRDIHVLRLPNYRFSNAPGATVTMTTKLVTISAPATTETMMILPLLAGNLPRIT